MPSKSSSLALVAASLASLLALPAHASCGSAYCSLNTDLGAEAAGFVEGSLLDLRFESIDQRQPRAGSKAVAVGEIPAHHDEVSTRNRNLIGTYSRMFASGWGFSVTAPLVDREHLHLHHHRGALLSEAWSFREIGDLRITGRYQAALAGSKDAPRTLGLVAGLKLPTGRTGVANGEGVLAERSLQPGTGTTDAVVGALFTQQLPQHGASWFAQAQVQRALDEHAGFRPGAQLSADLGYAQAFSDKLSAVVQLNAVVRGRDRGSEAEPADSGSRSLFLSPGLSYQLTGAVRTYAFYQHPLHQHVNGVQLTPDRALVLGVSTRF